MASETHGTAAQEHGEHGGHATVRTYVLIGVILTVLTAAEVAIFYVEALESVLVPALVIMSAGKFLLVVYYYMHLKWDHPIFSRVFFGPMILAAFGVVIGLVILFKWLPTLDPYR